MTFACMLKGKSRLPDKPSELLRLAVSDLIRCELSPKYNILMSQWVRVVNNQCCVCLAGAVLTQSLGQTTTLNPSDVYAHPEFAKLYALDSFRQGYIAQGLQEMSITGPEGLPATVEVASYARDPVQFKCDLLRMADQLKKVGL